MSVSLDGVKGFVGVGDDSYDALLSDCLAEAVALLASYVRHLRMPLEDGSSVGVTVTHDTTAGTYTWADNRDQAGLWLEELVPTEILDRCTIEVTSDLFARRNAPAGVVNQQFSSGDGPGSAPVRIHRDPLTAAYPLLARWSVPF